MASPIANPLLSLSPMPFMASFGQMPCEATVLILKAFEPDGRHGCCNGASPWTALSVGDGQAPCIPWTFASVYIAYIYDHIQFIYIQHATLAYTLCMQLLRAGVQNKNFTDSSVLCAQRSGSNVFPQSSRATAGLLLHSFARKNEIG